MSLRKISREIVSRLQAAGFEAFWVGGCVRDHLLGREPVDFDIATSARPVEIEALFERTLAVGKQFGVMVVVQGGHEFQVATFRAEADYTDGRRPGRVEFADARADSERRDFTINGLFLDPNTGRIFDWVGGEADLRARLVRTIGMPGDRFAEDHLRLLRAVRFAAQLGFEIEAGTAEAIRVNAGRISTVSPERVRDELLNVFRPPHAARGLDLLRSSGLLVHVLPEVAALVECEQSPDFHPEGTVFNHVRLMLDQLPSDSPESLPWTVLMHDIAKPRTSSRESSGAIHFYGHEKVGAEMTEEILQRLKFPRKQTDEVVQCVLHHMQFKDVRKMRRATIRRMILRETFPMEMELHRLDCLGSHRRLDHYEFMIQEREELQRVPAVVPPLLRGDDLIALGMKPGPAMGALLEEIRDKQLQEELKTCDQAREWARERMAGDGSRQ